LGRQTTCTAIISSINNTDSITVAAVVAVAAAVYVIVGVPIFTHG
jgi:hypothetical protein